MAVLGSCNYRYGGGSEDNRRVDFYTNGAVVIDITSGEEVSRVGNNCIYLEIQSTTQRAHTMGMAELSAKKAFGDLDTSLKHSIIQQLVSGTWKIEFENDPGPRFERVKSLTLFRCS